MYCIAAVGWRHLLVDQYKRVSLLSRPCNKSSDLL